MAPCRPPIPVLPIVAVISRHAAARDWGATALESLLGPIAFMTPPQPFTAGGYYQKSMGEDLLKQFVAFSPCDDPSALPAWKIATNEMESQFAEELASEFGATEARPLNLDCGYVTEAKLVLATTKDRDHRLYLQQGIYAEVTLSYAGRRWQDHRWTYPDYKTDLALQFAETCRLELRRHLTAIRSAV